MTKHKIGLSIDDDLYQALKKLPKDVSISDFFSILVDSAIEEIKNGKVMSDKDFIDWINSDPRRKEVREHYRKKIGPYIDIIDDNMQKFRENLVLGDKKLT